MTDNDLITPPTELVEQWHRDALKSDPTKSVAECIATYAARWGFNQRGAVNEAELQKARDEELEGCCEWLVVDVSHDIAGRLYAARRPKPKSQAEEAIAELDGIATCFRAGFGGVLKCDTIRAALERLRELEGNQ